MYVVSIYRVVVVDVGRDRSGSRVVGNWVVVGVVMVVVIVVIR